MTTLILDLWHDLRVKRLWPVALALVVAILALPMVLLGFGAEEPPAPVVEASGEEAAALGNLVDPTALPVAGSSRLDQFKARDPFKPEGPSGGAGGLGALTGGGEPLGGPSDVPDLPPMTGGGGTDATAATPPADGTANAALSGAASSPDVPASSSSGSAPTPPPPPTNGTPTTGDGSSDDGSGGSGGDPRETRSFTYEADLKFGKPGNVRVRAGVEEFTPLPNARRGVVLFNGVTIEDQLAVFSVFDSAEAPRIGADIREESCVIATQDETDPSVDRCLVFVLKARGERVRVGDYLLQVAAINRVRLR